MVRPSHLRKRKYKDNVDPEALKRQITVQKPFMVEQEGVYFPQVADLERKIKQICENVGVTTFLVAQYINFGRQLYSLSQKFSEATLENEACSLAGHWINRGLEPTLIVKVLALFNITCPSLPTTLGFDVDGIEKVILDNEERSTTYNETGATGLLLGSVKLPAPKDQHAISSQVLISFEAKYDVSAGDIYIRLYDGTIEIDLGGHMISFNSWGGYSFIVGPANSDDNVLYSLKGATTLELRIYLIGSSGVPDEKSYCRNLVATIIPFYKS